MPAPLDTRYASLECASPAACGNRAPGSANAGRAGSLGVYLGASAVASPTFSCGGHAPALAQSYYTAQRRGLPEAPFQIDAGMRVALPEERATACPLRRDRIPLPFLPALLHPDLDPRPHGIEVYDTPTCVRANACSSDDDCRVASCCGVVRAAGSSDYVSDVDSCSRVRGARCDLQTRTCAGPRKADS